MTGFLIALLTIWLLGAAVGMLFGAGVLLDAVDDEDTELGARIILLGVFFPLTIPILLYILLKKANLLTKGIKWH